MMKKVTPKIWKPSITPETWKLQGMIFGFGEFIYQDSFGIHDDKKFCLVTERIQSTTSNGEVATGVI